MFDWTSLHHETAAILAALSLLGMLWRFILRPAYRRTTTAWKTIDLVLRELSPNGGASLRDAITRMEHELARMNARQRLLMANYECGVFETDPEGRCVWVSPRYCTITGNQPDDLAGASWLASIHDHDRMHVAEEWRAAVSDGRRFEMEYRVRAGQRVHGSAQPVIYAGKVIAFLGELCPRSDA